MNLSRVVVVCMCVAALSAAAKDALAATVTGIVRDVSGAGVPGARVVLKDVATGREVVVISGDDGRYQVETASSGAHLLIVTKSGFSEAVRTIALERADQRLDVPVRLELAPMQAELSVTATRSAREVRQLPLHVESVTGDAARQANPLSTGGVLATAANVTPVGNGPFGVRPRLRGLDSTRVLVLVDGERLNTARQATERTGAEVGLIPVEAIDRIEIVNGAGTLLYGSDALAGTVNIVTTQFARTRPSPWLYGLNGFFSSNEAGRRGSAALGVSGDRYAIDVGGGAERFDNFRAGALDIEDTRPFFAAGELRRADTIDDAFGFAFGAFPDPFNAPFVRTDAEVPNSQARGNHLAASGSGQFGDGATLRVRYHRRQMRDIGFPDFAAPYFFNATSLPHSRLERVSARAEIAAPASWLAHLSIGAYYQRTERLLRNLLPVQFPAPTPVVFFPIAVMRLDILSDTEQRVWTPGVDVQARFTPMARHLLTAGLTMYRDRSEDLRTTVTTTSMVGQVVMGARGPAAVVLPAPVALGPAATAHPVRVPDASLRDVAVFLQDEWRVRPSLSIMAGVRGDFYDVTTDPTPGYDVAAVVAGASPAIDPTTLPDPAGARYGRRALTGDLGLVANAGGRLSPFVRVGRSYRHPNLEEMLFAGPATIGSIAPNVRVRPEVGTNVDAGAHFRLDRLSGGAYVFLNRYRDFIAQDLVVAATTSGPLAQATNYADVRIGGVELSASAPIIVGGGVVSLSGSAAFTRGTVVRGVDPLDGTLLDGTPADNITPAKAVVTARFTEPGGRWWVEYGVRAQTDVTAVASTLLESPFLIAQDLLSLDGFAVQRFSAGLRVGRDPHGVQVTLAVENLTDRYYREHFQFAPARGRSVTLGLRVGGF